MSVLDTNDLQKEQSSDNDLDEEFVIEKELNDTMSKITRSIASAENIKNNDTKQNIDLNLEDINISKLEIEKFCKQLTKMPANKITELLKNLPNGSKMNIEKGKDNFRNADKDHIDDPRKRLQQKLANKQFARKSNSSKEYEVERRQKIASTENESVKIKKDESKKDTPDVVENLDKDISKE